MVGKHIVSLIHCIVLIIYTVACYNPYVLISYSRAFIAGGSLRKVVNVELVFTINFIKLQNL